MARKYENLECYKLSVAIAAEIIPYAESIRPYRVGGQIAASALSISSNIAEGAMYKSERDFLRFLNYSLGSAAELLTQLDVLHLINPESGSIAEWKSRVQSITRMISRLMTSIEVRG